MAFSTRSRTESSDSFKPDFFLWYVPRISTVTKSSHFITTVLHSLIFYLAFTQLLQRAAASSPVGELYSRVDNATTGSMVSFGINKYQDDVVVCGHRFIDATNANGWVERLDPLGKRLWLTEIHAGTYLRYLTNPVILEDENTLVTTGSSFQDGQFRPVFSKFNLTDGAHLFTKILYGLPSGPSFITGMSLSPDNDLVAVGYVQPLGLRVILTSALEVKNVTTIDSLGFNVIYSVNFSEDGDMLLTGVTKASSGAIYKGMSAKLKKNSWPEVSEWVRIFTGSGATIILTNLVSNNTLAFAGTTGKYGMLCSQNIATGSVNWIKTPGNNQAATFNGLIKNELKNEWLALGTITNGAMLKDAWIYSISSDGVLGGSFTTGSSNSDTFSSGIIDSDGTLLATGNLGKGSSTIRYDSNYAIDQYILPNGVQYVNQGSSLAGVQQTVTDSAGTLTLSDITATTSLVDKSSLVTFPQSISLQSLRTQASPTGQPSMQPTIKPTIQPSSRPSVRPNSWPTRMPSGQPSKRPTLRPSNRPSDKPAAQPSTQPSARPTLRPSKQPSAQPTNQPSMQPSRQPTVQPSSRPSVRPSSWPTKMPSGQPSTRPTLSPTKRPSVKPTGQPSHTSSARPTFRPSLNPSSQSRSTPIVNASNRTKLSSSEISAIVICIVFLSTLAPFVLKKNRSWLKQKTQGFFSAEQKPKFNQILPDLTKLEEGTMTQAPQDLSSDNRLSPHRRDSLLILLSQLYIKIQKQTDPVHPETLESIQEKLSNTIGRISSNVTTPEQALDHQSSSLDQDDDSISLNLKLLLDHEEMMRNKIADFMSRTDERCTTPTPSEFAAMDQYYSHRRDSVIRGDGDFDSSSESSCELK